MTNSSDQPMNSNSLMESTYRPEDIEQHWYERWENSGCFEPAGDGKPFSIMIPPPNVTGRLHMGHGFNNTIMDTMVRYHRMCGDRTLWQPGTDHAGIATQMIVERQLSAEGLSRHDLGREKFLDRVWEWKAKSGGFITGQIRRLGSSVDWSRERFTMDEDLSKAVLEAFVRLHEDGLIYRGKRLVNWDIQLQTAISDLEVESVDQEGSLWHFRYPLADGVKTAAGDGWLTVATTRPETLLGDAAVAVHPEDSRFSDLVGKWIELPLTKRRIPIVADEHADPEKGTGCVKITPAHDFSDYEVGKRQNLPLINIFDSQARLLALAQAFDIGGNAIHDEALTALLHLPEELAGLERFEARKAVVAAMDELGLLGAVEKHSNKIPKGDRSGVVIEPWLTDQWYVKASAMAQQAIDVVENGSIRFVPKQYENMYFSWMRDLQDWCISRQLWWGHRIPAWYDEEGNYYVGRSEAEVREKHSLGDRGLLQDEDVLDTWFSSGLWTFSTLGWPEQTPELERFHPSSLLVTGFDIIFFWVARMIMMSTQLLRNEDGTPQVPFNTVYVHGLVRDAEGKKMSKSKGNVLDPLDIIDGISLEDLLEKRTEGLMQPKIAERIRKQTKKEFPDGIAAYGTDALRFCMCSLASTGRDINFDMKRVEGYRNFCNKIWNATRFVLMNVEGQPCGEDGSNDFELGLPERWIRSALQQVESDCHRHIGQYRFDLLAQTLYEFVWNEYCDWYVELAKITLNDESASPERKLGTRRTLVRVLETWLRLLHPIMPFITESLWQQVAQIAGKPIGSGEEEFTSIMRQPYPVAESAHDDPEAESSIGFLKQVTVAVRNVRGEMNISPGKTLSVLWHNPDPAQLDRLQSVLPLWLAAAKLDSAEALGERERPFSATQMVGQLELLIPLEGIIDMAAEQQRLAKELDRLEKESARLEGKLNNESFTARAPADVVAKEQAKLDDAQLRAKTLREQLERMSG